MAGTVPARAPLGASTTNRKWYLDVRDPQTLAWVGVFGIAEAKPRPSEATTQDDSDFDGEGYKSQTVTALTWGFDGKVNRKELATSATAYDPGQEIIRKASDTIGGVVHCRYYEMEPNGPRVEAYQGKGVPSWAPDGGAMDSLDTAPFTLTGRGKPVEIAHPSGETPTPRLISATPSGAAAGAPVVLKGFNLSGLTTVASVKVNNVNVASITPVDANTVLVTMPAGAAGTVPITVTGGTAPLLYTRGA